MGNSNFFATSLTDMCLFQVTITGEWALCLFNKQNYKTFQIRYNADNFAQEETGTTNHMSASFPLRVSIPNKHKVFFFLTDNQGDCHSDSISTWQQVQCIYQGFHNQWNQCNFREPMQFQVLTVASMKITIFWDVALCSLVEVYQHFRGSYCLHHHRPVVGKDIPDYMAQHPRRQSSSMKIMLVLRILSNLMT
jgi:hypothetical protein